MGRDLPTAVAPTSARVKANVAAQRQLRADRHHLARSQRPVELDRRVRDPVEPRRRRLDGHGRYVGHGRDRGPQPGLQQLLPVPRTGARRGRQLEHVGRHDRAVPRHAHERSQPLRPLQQLVVRRGVVVGDVRHADEHANAAVPFARYTFTRKGHRARHAPKPVAGLGRGADRRRVRRQVSLWASSLKARQIVFSRGWSTTATRTIELRTVTSSSRKLVSLDAFVVTR